MTETTRVRIDCELPDILHSMLQVGANLATIDDIPTMASMILREARRVAGAEAGSLYLCTGDSVRLAAAQNDRIGSEKLIEVLLDRELPVNSDTLVGFVASTGQAVNIADSYALPTGTPFRIRRANGACWLCILGRLLRQRIEQSRLTDPGRPDKGDGLPWAAPARQCECRIG